MRVACPSSASPALVPQSLLDQVLRVLGILFQHPPHTVCNTDLLASVNAFELKMEQKSQFIHEGQHTWPAA